MADLEGPAPTADNDLRHEANELLKAKKYSQASEIMQRIFDGKDVTIANNLGFVHSIEGSREYDLAKAIEYYLVSAKQGDVHGQYGLGAMFWRLGQMDESIRWYREASNGGDGDCSYNVYRLLKDRGELGRARLALELGARQGQPACKARGGNGAHAWAPRREQDSDWLFPMDQERSRIHPVRGGETRGREEKWPLGVPSQVRSGRLARRHDRRSKRHHPVEWEESLNRCVSFH